MATTIYLQSAEDGEEDVVSQRWIKPCYAFNYMLSGGATSINSGLDVDVAALDAFIRGMYLSIDSATTLTMNDDSTNYIELQLTRTSGKVVDPASDSDNFNVTTSDVSGTSDTIVLAVVETASGSVSNIYDMRWWGPGASFLKRIYPEGSQTITSDTTANVIEHISLPLAKEMNGDTMEYFVEAELRFESTANTGLKVGWDATENIGNHNVNWRCFENGGTLADSGSGGTTQGAFFFSTSAEFDGFVEISMRLGVPDDHAVLQFLFAQNTSSTDSTTVRQNGSWARITAPNLYYAVSSNSFRT